MVKSIIVRVHPKLYKCLKRLSYIKSDKINRPYSITKVSLDIAKELEKNGHRYI